MLAFRAFLAMFSHRFKTNKSPRLVVQFPVPAPYKGSVKIVRITCSAFEVPKKNQRGTNGTDEYPCFKQASAQSRAIAHTVEKAQKLDFYSGVTIELGSSAQLGRNTSTAVEKKQGLFPHRDSIHNNVSAKHFSVRYDGDGYLWIEDNGSLNGTHILRPDSSDPTGFRKIDLMPKVETPLKVGDFILVANEHLLQVQLVPEKK